MHLCLIDWVVHLPSIYMHCTRSSSSCSGMKLICAWLTGGLDLAVGVVVCKASMLEWLWGSICLLYICIVLYLAMGVVVCKASMLEWLWGSICLLYICIVLYLAMGVVVCKASMLDWLGRSRSSSQCNSMQCICAQLAGGSTAFYV